MAMSSMVRVLVAVVAVAAVADLATAASTYDVGDSNGWTLAVDYTKWVADKKFFPGDSIIFTYSSSSHDVVEVNAADYAACSASNPISTSSSGKTSVTLSAVGKRYFLCSVSNHCAQGMKVEIDVAAASTKSLSPSSSPAGAPSSPSGSSPSPRSPSSSPADAPSSPSGSSPSPRSPSSSPADGPSSSPSGSSPSTPSTPAPSAAARSTYALGLGMLAVAAFGLVM